MTRATGWLLVALLTAACGATPESRSVPAKSAVTALVGGRVQADPEAAAIPDGVVLIAEGRITAVGRRADVPVPTGAMVIDCASGGTVICGSIGDPSVVTRLPSRSR